MKNKPEFLEDNLFGIKDPSKKYIVVYQQIMEYLLCLTLFLVLIAILLIHFNILLIHLHRVFQLVLIILLK